MPFSLLDYSWIALVVMIGSCLQGAGGIGFGMFVGPVLAIGHPDLVPGPVLLLAGLLSTMSAAREFRAIDFPVLGYSLAGRLPASIAGGMLFALLPVRSMSIVFALLILGAVGLSLRGWHVRASPKNLVLAGAVSGFMGTITSVGAPPMAIAYQDFPPPKLRATIGAFFVVGAVGSLAVLQVVGRFGTREALLGFSLVPPMMLGFAVSNLIVPHIDRAKTRIALLVMSGIAAAALLALQVT